MGSVCRGTSATTASRPTTNDTSPPVTTFVLIDIMDALAGYGSDSDSSQDNKNPAGALSGLLGSCSDSDDEQGNTSNEPPVKKAKQGECDDANRADVTETKIQHFADVLSNPKLLDASCDPFQSLSLFTKDYTVGLREKLLQQIQSQTQSAERQDKRQQQLTKKLEQMYETFQSANNGSNSFATHLKSQHTFHNPHLLKDIITHFEIQPLESNTGNKFAEFEYVDRIMSAEERSRIAASGSQGPEELR